MRKLMSAIAVAGSFLPKSGVAPVNPQHGTAYRFSFKTITGEPMPLERYRGKVLLIVNTASHCGFTKQYEGLQALWDQYGERGLVVIGVPSNDFGEQEPKDNHEILEFCRDSYGVSFPLTAKVTVRGKDAHPFYKWATDVFGQRGAPRWNFHKYLVAADGRLICWSSTGTKPLAKDLTEAIESALNSAETGS